MIEIFAFISIKHLHFFHFALLLSFPPRNQLFPFVVLFTTGLPALIILDIVCSGAILNICGSKRIYSDVVLAQDCLSYVVFVKRIATFSTRNRNNTCFWHAKVKQARPQIGSHVLPIRSVLLFEEKFEFWVKIVFIFVSDVTLLILIFVF